MSKTGPATPTEQKVIRAGAVGGGRGRETLPLGSLFSRVWEGLKTGGCIYTLRGTRPRRIMQFRIEWDSRRPISRDFLKFSKFRHFRCRLVHSKALDISMNLVPLPGSKTTKNALFFTIFLQKPKVPELRRRIAHSMHNNLIKTADLVT